MGPSMYIECRTDVSPRVLSPRDVELKLMHRCGPECRAEIFSGGVN